MMGGGLWVYLIMRALGWGKFENKKPNMNDSDEL